MVPVETLSSGDEAMVPVHIAVRRCASRLVKLGPAVGTCPLPRAVQLGMPPEVVAASQVAATASAPNPKQLPKGKKAKPAKGDDAALRDDAAQADGSACDAIERPPKKKKTQKKPAAALKKHKLSEVELLRLQEAYVAVDAADFPERARPTEEERAAQRFNWSRDGNGARVEVHTKKKESPA